MPGALQPSLSPDGRTLAVTMREAAIEVIALAAGSPSAEDKWVYHPLPTIDEPHKAMRRKEIE